MLPSSPCKCQKLVLQNRVQSIVSNSALSTLTSHLTQATIPATSQEPRTLRQSVEFEQLFRAVLAMPIDSCQKQNRIYKKQQTQTIHYRYPEIKYSKIKLYRREEKRGTCPPAWPYPPVYFVSCYSFERIFC